MKIEEKFVEELEKELNSIRLELGNLMKKLHSQAREIRALGDRLNEILLIIKKFKSHDKSITESEFKKLLREMERVRKVVEEVKNEHNI